MFRLDDIAIFVEVVRNKSFKRAAEILSMPSSTLSRRISLLEKEIGLRLIRRSTRKLELTEAGKLYFERSNNIIDEARNAHFLLNDLLSKPVGNLRISLPTDLSIYYIAPAIVAFSKKHPDITFQLDMTPRKVDLINEPFDLVIRIGEMPNSGLISRHMLSMNRYLYASPEYLRKNGEPAHPLDLEKHSCLVMNTPLENDGWNIVFDNILYKIKGKSRYKINNVGMLCRFAILGEGITLMAEEIAKPEIQLGKLKQILPSCSVENLSVYILTENKLTPAKTSLFIDFLCDYFRK